MRVLKFLTWTVVGIIAIVVIVGLLLPDHAHVERSTVIDAAPDKIYPLVSDFRQFNRWSPWLARDPQTTIEFDGPPSGVGAKMRWSSDHPGVGHGSQEVVDAQAPTMVKTYLDFGDQGDAYATFRIEAEGTGSRVTWMLDSDFGFNLMGRYFGLMFDEWVGPDYEDGLARLKQLAESES